tara:strand:- start:642 stop:1511 length:870 start_codon:yes stop_codon:yes gene_type:complete
MFGNHFYHQKIRKSVAMFGTMFNNLYVLRTNAAGNVLNQVRVPLSYAPRDKYLARIQADPDLQTGSRIAIKLPRLSFEITAIQYDQNRKLPKMQRFNVPKKGAETGKRGSLYSPVPYIISFQLNAYARNQDDALQIVEQIIPYFSPQYTLTIRPFEEYPTIKEDVPITLNGVSFTDDFEGPLEQRRTIIYTLDFTMNINFYSDIRENALINRAIVNTEFPGDSAGINNIVARHTITPNPATANPEDDFGFNTVLEEPVGGGALARDQEEGEYAKLGYVDIGYVRNRSVK